MFRNVSTFALGCLMSRLLLRLTAQTSNFEFSNVLTQRRLERWEVSSSLIMQRGCGEKEPKGLAKRFARRDSFLPRDTIPAI